MARETKEMSALEVGRISAVGYHFVGGVSGLVLQVSKSGTKSWLLRVLVGGKRREIGLGGFPDVTLAGARDAARATKAKIKAGIDPVAERLAARSALAAAVASSLTFKQAAEKYIEANEAGWKNPKHAAQWTSTLETYAYPTIGNLQLSHIDTSHVVGILEAIWNTKTETASRLRGRIESVLDWAKVRGYRKGENPARWKGHLDHILPARNKVQKVRHHAALDYRDIGAFLAALKAVDGMGARALEFAILCASRSNEVRGATWGEIDQKSGVWVIPAERMKAEREHRVPLSPASLAVLESLPRMAGTDLIFPNAKNDVLSDMTLTAVIRRMNEASTKDGGDGWNDSAGKVITAHGFRSTFRDWAGETTAYPREVIEHALAHQLKDKAEAAYQRGDLLDKRRRLMADWAKYCSTPSKQVATVTGIRGAA
ncbi:integrase arm-type DNA-binding domain-containing protein [Dechloromonas agitata]|uniref:tyrosine-type recombinase/integrase n=1 Tax=Dechloromonas agitata TaxID=73030 RepID=UPI00237E1749|nr:site-specific integrase [Dechloromonas agitata]MDE1547134.1 integrase arm-type DNA-binding domain-containing protein [Dechloromonas agitata]